MKEVTIIVSDEDFDRMMRHAANNHPGQTTVAVQMIRAVEGDEAYNLGEFEDGAGDPRRI